MSLLLATALISIFWLGGYAVYWLISNQHSAIADEIDALDRLLESKDA